MQDPSPVSKKLARIEDVGLLSFLRKDHPAREDKGHLFRAWRCVHVDRYQMVSQTLHVHLILETSNLLGGQVDM